MRGWALVLLLGACAAKHPVKEDPAPAWSTPEGRDKARLDLIGLLLEADNVDGALTLIAQLRTEGFKGPDLDVLHGRALRRAGLSEDARTVLEGVPRRHPAYAGAQNEIGLLEMENANLEGAISAFQEATHANSEQASYWNNLGFALQSAGRPGEAVVALRRSLLLDSAALRTRNNLGFALIRDGRESEAYRVFRAGASEADARYNLGLGLELAGQLQKAAAAYQDALNVDPNHALAHQGLDRVTASGTGGAGPINPSHPAMESL